MKYMREFADLTGSQEDYIRRHQLIWPEMVNLIQNAGLLNYSIWSHGKKLIEYFECDDIDKAVQVIKSSPIKRKWDQYMKDILDIKPEENSEYTCFYDSDV